MSDWSKEVAGLVGAFALAIHEAARQELLEEMRAFAASRQKREPRRPRAKKKAKRSPLITDADRERDRQAGAKLAKRPRPHTSSFRSSNEAPEREAKRSKTPRGAGAAPVAAVRRAATADRSGAPVPPGEAFTTRDIHAAVEVAKKNDATVHGKGCRRHTTGRCGKNCYVPIVVDPGSPLGKDSGPGRGALSARAPLGIQRAARAPREKGGKKEAGDYVGDNQAETMAPASDEPMDDLDRTFEEIGEDDDESLSEASHPPGNGRGVAAGDGNDGDEGAAAETENRTAPAEPAQREAVAPRVPFTERPVIVRVDGSKMTRVALLVGQPKEGFHHIRLAVGRNRRYNARVRTICDGELVRDATDREAVLGHVPMYEVPLRKPTA